MIPKAEHTDHTWNTKCTKSARNAFYNWRLSYTKQKSYIVGTCTL